VYAEQGLGDAIQFVRYLPQVAQRVGRVVCELQPALIPLIEQAGFGEHAQFVPRGTELPVFDAQVPLLSLPGLLGTTLENIPDAAGYLKADPARAEKWRDGLGEQAKFRVGIVWQGTKTYSGDRERSIALAQFAPLAMEGVELVSLQKGFGVEQIAAVADRFAVRDLGPDFDATGGAFLDTAAVMESLDLVITSDTALAHLAGALGKETWLALSLVPDWRWMFERENSPWYSSLRLFRQSRFGDWEEVFARMARELTERLQ